MCDQATRTVIEELVQDKIEKSEMFTAWDITRALSASGIKERHRDVKRVVHGLFADGEMEGYARKTVALPSVQGPAPWVYHPEGTDPNDYANQGNIAPAKAATTTDDEDDEDDDTASRLGGIRPSRTVARTTLNPDGTIDRSAGNRDYLYVPKTFVKDSGLRPGDTVYVQKDGNELVLTEDEEDGLVTLAKYSVDAKGNVRIPKAHLPAKTGAQPTWHISGSAQAIHIK